MHNEKFDQTLPPLINDELIAALTANALRNAHRNDSSAVKKIGMITGANLCSISKWYQAINAPSSAHLLTLVRCYPELLKSLLEVIGRSDVWALCLAENIPDKMSAELAKRRSKQALFEDKYVLINVSVRFDLAKKFNQRQLWFVGELQRGKKLKASNIAAQWRVSHKTAQRDIAGIVKQKLIRFNGARKNGFYGLV